MKNIKIAPYPNLKISEECYEKDVVANSAKPEENVNGLKKSLLNFSAPNFIVAEFTGGDKRVIRPGPTVSTEDAKYFSIFPNPVHLYLDFAIKCFNDSETIKKTSFPFCANKKKKIISGAFLLDADVDETHNCYNEFFKLRMTSIIMLTTSVEAFINHTIPNDYPNREHVERFGKFNDKLTTNLPESLNLTNFWDNKGSLRDALINLNYLRNDLIHLKTNSNDGFVAYFSEIDKMLKFNISKAISDVIAFMNSISPNFIESIADTSNNS